MYGVWYGNMIHSIPFHSIHSFIRLFRPSVSIPILLCNTKRSNLRDEKLKQQQHPKKQKKIFRLLLSSFIIIVSNSYVIRFIHRISFSLIREICIQENIPHTQTLQLLSCHHSCCRR